MKENFKTLSLRKNAVKDWSHKEKATNFHNSQGPLEAPLINVSPRLACKYLEIDKSQLPSTGIEHKNLAADVF